MGYRMFWNLSIALSSEKHGGGLYQICVYTKIWGHPVISRRDECDHVFYGILREAGFQRVKCDLTLERCAVGS